MTKTYSGACLCGAIRFHAAGRPKIVAQCHCEECRRHSGTGHAIGAMFAKNAVEITGSLSTYTYVSAKGSQVTKAFCETCGSPIYGTNSQTPDFLTVALGAMDDADDLQIEVVIFARDKPNWDSAGQSVACFETQPDWTPDG